MTITTCPPDALPLMLYHLMLCSFVPDISGSGLATRAGNFFEAVLEEHTVTFTAIAPSISCDSQKAIAY
jgi:hypothetical protein